MLLFLMLILGLAALNRIATGETSPLAPLEIKPEADSEVFAEAIWLNIK